MAIDPEILPPSSNAGDKAVTFLPKWALILGIAILAFILLGVLKTLFPLIVMALLVGFIWRESRKR